MREDAPDFMTDYSIKILSFGLELSYGVFDVVYFEEKLNFFDAEKEKSKILIRKL